MISAYMFQHYCQMNSSDNALKDSPWHLNTPKFHLVHIVDLFTLSKVGLGSVNFLFTPLWKD